MDSRFRLKISFDIYDQHFDWDASLNWTAEMGRIDERIEDWFLRAHDNAYTKWVSEQESAKEIEKLNIRDRLAKAAYQAYNNAFHNPTVIATNNDPWVNIANSVVDEYVRINSPNNQ